MATKANAQPLNGNYVLETKQPEKGVFEIGLVMAGAVSAGAYEAGVLDFLFEALDAWEDEKKRAQETGDKTVPQHRVLIRVVTAASAGSMTAAMMAVAAGRKFSHVSSRELGRKPYSKQNEEGRKRCDEAGEQNPFFYPWVMQVSIQKLLGTQDLEKTDAVMTSLLDCTELENITQDCLNFTGDGRVSRAYLANPTRYIFSIGNLRGIPYFFNLTGTPNEGLRMSTHRDFRSFTVTYNGQNAAQKLRDDDIALDWSYRPGWNELGNMALASGAFPVGLAPRRLDRDPIEYSYRFVVVPDENNTLTFVPLQADGSQWPDGKYSSFVVDGGTMNNEPVDLARQELAGLMGRNKRDGVEANRAILMIDPFPDRQSDISTAGKFPNLLKTFPDLMGAWSSQARFSAEDIALAATENVYSRFLVAPSRDDGLGFNLAGGALGGFAGFLSRDFRQHDYLLGRRNAQKFLYSSFTLPAENSLFDSYPKELKTAGKKWVTQERETGTLCLPIIPLVGSLLPQSLHPDAIGYEEQQPDWPRHCFDYAQIKDLVKDRVNKLVDHAISNSSLPWYRALPARTLALAIRGWALAKIEDAITKELKERGQSR